MKTSALILALSLSLAGALTAGTPATASAKGSVVTPPEPERAISYSNFRVSWLHTEFDSSGLDDADGVGAALEWALCPISYITVGGGWERVSTVVGDIDVAGAHIGIGLHHALCPEADIVVEVGSNYEDADIGGDDFGVFVSPHIRALIGPVEAHLGAFYSSAFDGEWVGFTNVFIPLPGVDNLDLALGANLGDEYWGFSVGGRIRF